MEDIVTYHEFDSYGYATGKTLSLSIFEGVKGRWTLQAPPQVPDDHYAVFDGIQWTVVDSQPIIVEQPVEVPQVNPEAPVELA